jgi:hypothetical protein
LRKRGSAVVYYPGPIESFTDVSTSSHGFIWQFATTVKFIVENGPSAKVFIITDKVYAAGSATALAQGPLLGLARVVASEHSNIWGGLIDNEGPQFPVMPLKHVHEQDVMRCVDGVRRVARMRPFSSDQLCTSQSDCTLLPKAEGTYVITGGLGALGLESCDFLIEKGARRIVIISHREIPPRNQWQLAFANLFPILNRIRAMERLGASIHVISSQYWGRGRSYQTFRCTGTSVATSSFGRNSCQCYIGGQFVDRDNVRFFRAGVVAEDLRRYRPSSTLSSRSSRLLYPVFFHRRTYRNIGSKFICVR